MKLGERSIKIRNALNACHRARHLLSGLLACSMCGAGYTLVGGDRYACADHVNRGTCNNRRTVSRGAIERRVLAGLKERLLVPELVAEFVREFHDEWNRRVREAEAGRSSMERELADIEREVYRRKVADLEAALNMPEEHVEAHAALRGLIDRIVLHPGVKRGEISAEVHGEIAALWQLGITKKKPVLREKYGFRWLRGSDTRFTELGVVGSHRQRSGVRRFKSRARNQRNHKRWSIWV